MAVMTFVGSPHNVGMTVLTFVGSPHNVGMTVEMRCVAFCCLFGTTVADSSFASPRSDVPRFAIHEPGCV